MPGERFGTTQEAALLQPARLHVIVRGLVQGVGFRYYTIEAAHRLGLMSWVRNNRDGSVEALAEGDRTQLKQWLEALRRGPKGARVTDVETTWGTASAEFHAFTLRHG